MIVSDLSGNSGTNSVCEMNKVLRGNVSKGKWTDQQKVWNTGDVYLFIDLLA